MASVPLRRNREFRLLWSGQAVSALGSQITLVAYPLLVLAVTGSAAKAGVVGFARQLPIAVLALPAGALADRMNRKHLMVTCDAVRAVALASIPIAIVAGSVPYPLIVLVAVIDGAGFVFTYVTERGAMRQLVAPEQLGERSLRTSHGSSARCSLARPSEGFCSRSGRRFPLVADSVSYAASAASKLLIRSEC
jgi:MFS family permease